MTFSLGANIGLSKDVLNKMLLLSFVPKRLSNKRYRLFVSEIETKTIELLSEKFRFKNIIIIFNALKSVSPKNSNELYNFIKRHISEIKQLFNLQVNGYYLLDANVFTTIFQGINKSIEREKALYALVEELDFEYCNILAKIESIRKKSNLEAERVRLILDLKFDVLRIFREGVRKRGRQVEQ